MHSVINWLYNYFEIWAFITGLIYIYFSIKQSVLLWPLGLISSALQIKVFYDKGIYADMSLQVYYVIISAYGWYFWVFGKRKSEKNLPVIRMNIKNWVIFVISNGIVFFIIRHILMNYTDSTIVNIDSFTSALSITGTVLLARKYIENWMVFIVVDVISTGLYVYKEIYYTSALFLVFSVLAWVGYFKWRKDLKDA